MSDDVELARDGMEHAEHAHPSDTSARKIAVLIAILAAALALSELGEKAAQNAYLTNHIQASDDWAFYQAKTIRQDMFKLHAEALETLPNAADPVDGQTGCRCARHRGAAERRREDGGPGSALGTRR